MPFSHHVALCIFLIKVHIDVFVEYIDRIFNDGDDLIGLQEERTLEINETVPKIHVNTKSLQEIEDFKKKLMKEKEDSENLQDLKLIKEVSTLSI